MSLIPVGYRRKKQLLSRLSLLERDRKKVLQAIESEDNNESMDHFWLMHLKNLDASISQINSVLALGESPYEQEFTGDYRQSSFNFA